MFNEKIPADQYAQLADRFNPRFFDPLEWAHISEDAGMKYSVMVARHHDGFALWDSPGSVSVLPVCKPRQNAILCRSTPLLSNAQAFIPGRITR